MGLLSEGDQGEEGNGVKTRLQKVGEEAVWRLDPSDQQEIKEEIGFLMRQ